MALRGILEHDDHADALLAVCRVLGGRTEVTAARMVGVDRYGFDAPVDTTDCVRTAMIDLVRRTR